MVVQRSAPLTAFLSGPPVLACSEFATRSIGVGAARILNVAIGTAAQCVPQASTGPLPVNRPPPVRASPPNNSVNFDDRSPIVLSELVRQLQDYPIREDAKFLEDGFRDGFRLGYTGVLRS